MHTTILLDAAASENSGSTMNIVFIVAIFVIFYFFMIRPQNKKRKQLNEMRESLKKGDAVVTIGGIHGKVIEIKDTTVVVSVDANTKLKVDKTSISMDASTKLTEEKKA
jgi:preprotein translocase subunit YajC